MTGKELYALYTEASAQQNCGVDPWEDIGEMEQAIWEALAALIEERR